MPATTEIPWFSTWDIQEPKPDGATTRHRFDRLEILDLPEAVALERHESRRRLPPRPPDLTRTEQLGLSAQRRRQSRAWAELKANLDETD